MEPARTEAEILIVINHQYSLEVSGVNEQVNPHSPAQVRQDPNQCTRKENKLKSGMQ